MSQPVIFFVTRHGETLLNLLGRVQGWSDSPLTPQGVQDACLLAEMMESIPFHAAFSSDSGRAVETARLILSRGNREDLSLRQDRRLREWCFGSLEALPMKELTEAISRGLGGALTMGEMNARMEELPDAIKQADRSGWTEGFDGVRRRLISFFRQTAEETSAQGGGNILVVSHAFSIKTVLYLLAPQRLGEVEKIQNASVTTILWREGVFEVQAVNQRILSSQ